MSTERLFTSLAGAWDRAVAVSNSEDLPREYINVILPLMPDAAEAMLRAQRGTLDYGEAWLMREHAPLLARHARELFFERVFEVPRPFSPVVLLAQAAEGVSPAERGEFRAKALPALEAEHAPGELAYLLLAWRRVEPDDVAAELTERVLALLPSVPDMWITRIAHMFGRSPREAERRALLARIDAVPDPSAELLLTRCELLPAKERTEAALRALRKAEGAGSDKSSGIFYTALSVRELVGFEVARPWIERHLRELTSMRDLAFALHRVGSDLPDELLDLAEERYRSLRDGVWRVTTLLADLARLHAKRREALLTELRPMLERVVGDPLLGHRLKPAECRNYSDIDTMRASIAMEASAAFEGDERRALQRRALAIVERADTGFDRRFDLDFVRWSELGDVLDPSLHAEAVRVALGMRYRPAALTAVGKLVARLPESSRHLALLGLSRLADGAPPEHLSVALAALDSASRLPPVALAARRGADRVEAAWTERDQVALDTFEMIVTGEPYRTEAVVRELSGMLTPAAARRAATWVLAMESRLQRSDAAAALADCELLEGSAERDALIAELLHADRRSPPLRYAVERFVTRVLRVCGERDAAWAERVALWIDESAWSIESFLVSVTQLAPTLRRLGGPELVSRLAARLRAPLAASEVGLPWAQSPVGSFDA